jgi:hypothetical protein
LRSRVQAAVHRRASALESEKARRITGVSLVAALCASALAPVAIASLAVGPVVVAGVGLVGGLGAARLSEMIDQALDALRRKGEAPTEAAVERQLAAQLPHGRVLFDSRPWMAPATSACGICGGP